MDARGGKVVAKAASRDGGATRPAPSTSAAQPSFSAREPACQRRAVKARWRSDWRVQPCRNGRRATHKLSNRQWEQLLRQNFINIRRVREWRDIHSQLLTVVKEQQWLINNAAGGLRARCTCPCCRGLLGNIGYKGEESDAYLGARGIKFHPHPGAHLIKKPGRWIVAAELVETSRLYGRGIAAIEPQWLEEVGAPSAEEAAAGPALEQETAPM